MESTLVAIQRQHDCGGQVETLLLEIERLADTAEWEKIEIVLHRLPGLVTRVPEGERGEILSGTLKRIESIRQQALVQSDELAEKLATIKTGRRAAASYQATGALANAT